MGGMVKTCNVMAFLSYMEKEKLGRIRAVESSPYWKPVTELICKKGDSILVSSNNSRNDEGQQECRNKGTRNGRKKEGME